MTAPTMFELAVAAVPTVQPTAGLLAVWELVEKFHEVYHHGRWLLLDEAQRGGESGPGLAPIVYLKLEGLTETRTRKEIDARGRITDHPYEVHLGPVRAHTAATLVRARPR